MEGEGGGAACAKRHCALLRGDGTLVADSVAEQCDVAARPCCIDLALVDDATRAISAKNSGGAIQAGVVEVQGGGCQSTDIDQRTPPEQDAVRIDQVHLSIGVQATEDLRAVGIKNAVDCDGAR